MKPKEKEKEKEEKGKEEEKEIPRVSGSVMALKKLNSPKQSSNLPRPNIILTIDHEGREKRKPGGR